MLILILLYLTQLSLHFIWEVLCGPFPYFTLWTIPEDVSWLRKLKRESGLILNSVMLLQGPPILQSCMTGELLYLQIVSAWTAWITIYGVITKTSASSCGKSNSSRKKLPSLETNSRGTVISLHVWQQKGVKSRFFFF